MDFHSERCEGVSGENSEYILEFRHITKTFPGVKALSDVNFGIRKGSVHVLCGENGAGKSTLFKVINGLYKPDEGDVMLDGQVLHVNGPAEALRAGIAMIYQELNIIPEMTVLENMFLGHETTRMNNLFLAKGDMAKEAQSYLDAQGLHMNIHAKMKNLSVAEAQMLEIVKAISSNAKVILMDEPTSSLTEKEVEFLFKKIAELKAQGITIIYVSHKMEEIFQIADEITVLRDGTHVRTLPASQTDVAGVIEMMVGRKMEEVYPRKTATIGDVRLKVQNLSREGVFKDVSFELRRGEILGMSGLVGAGRTEIARALMAMDPKDSGVVWLDGKKLEIKTVNDAITNGIVMVPEDRRRQGLSLIHSVGDNIALVSYRHIFKSPWLKHGKIRELIDRMIKLFAIKVPNPQTKAETLSGGNQQKVVLGKWMSVDPCVLILDEPTKGIDVGTKYEIYKKMHEMCDRGVSILIIDSDMEELIGMSDRVVVVHNGRIQGELQKDEISSNRIMHLAVGGVLG